MSQQVQELIEKIKAEGVQAADQKAKEIKNNAMTAAQKVSSEAEKQAQKIIADANTQAKKIHESTQMALKQAARDTILALKKEIERTLQKIVAKQVNDVLSSEQLAGIISDIAKKSIDANLVDNDILVTVSEKNLNSLTHGFIGKLQKEIKKPIKFQSNDTVSSGFTISYDQGKSCFDFTDEGLTEYLSAYLNTQVAALLRG